MTDDKPQSVQFGKQPPTDSPNVEFGKHVGSAETVTHSAGDEAPSHDDDGETTTGGIVPEFAGGDPVPADDASDADDAESAPE